MATPDAAATRRRLFFPSLSGYQRESLPRDLLAGVATGTVVIPQAMAYATIAGLPVQVGLYTCILPMVVYAVLGGSRSLSISTTSTIAILTASAVAAVPSERSHDELLRDAFTLTLLVGLCLLVMRLFRLGTLVEQISPATLTGVKTGVGLTVAASQLPALLGIAGDKDDGGFFSTLGYALSRVGDADLTTVLVAVLAIAALLVLRRVAPDVPGPLVVAVGGILLVTLTDVEEHGLSVIGAVPTGLPTPTMPMFADVQALLPGALAIAVMAFLETVLVARGQRQRSEPPVDSDRELLATGLAAVAGGLSQCMPPAGGFSQSAVNERAGARSQLAGVVTAALAVLVALFLGPVLENLPDAVLAAMVMVAVLGLVAPRDFLRYWRIDHREFWVAAVVAALGLTAGLLLAVGVGVGLTLILVLHTMSRPQVRPLYPRAGSGWTTNPPAEGAQVPSYDGVLLLHLDGSIYTGSARVTHDAVVAAALAADPRPQAVVLEALAVTDVTVTGIDALRSLEADLRTEGITLMIAGLPAASLEVMRRSTWFAAAERRGFSCPTVDDAVRRAEELIR